jgi:hypothetical protein
MTDHANELRRHARKIPHPQGETPGVMLRAADEIECLRIENEAPRDKVEQMERQEPVALVESWVNGSYSRNYKLRWLRDVNEGAKLYALPGAQSAPSLASGDVSRISGGKTQPAPSVPKLHVGNLPTVNQDAYPALGAWWVQLWDGDSVFARVYGASQEEASSRAAMLAAVPEAK